MNTEQELTTMDSEIKALKTAYPIAASKLRFYVFSSQDFTVTNQQTARFKFTPNYSTGTITFVNLRASITVNGTEVGFSPQVNEPQDGSGEVIIKVQFEPYYSNTPYTVRIMASGASTGTFSMI